MTNGTYAVTACGEVLNYLTSVSGKVLSFDAREFTYDWAKIKNPSDDYLGTNAKLEELYASIHIDQSTKEPIYEKSSERVAEGYANDAILDYSNWYDKMKSIGY